MKIACSRNGCTLFFINIQNLAYYFHKHVLDMQSQKFPIYFFYIQKELHTFDLLNSKNKLL